MAHPDLEHAVAFGRGEILDALQQPGMAPRPDLGIAELALIAPAHFTAELLRHGLHAIADAEHRKTHVPDRLRRSQSMVFIRAAVTARQDDAFGIEITNEGIAYVVRMDFAIDMGFTNPARDELGDL